jgi:hypothetical protein
MVVSLGKKRRRRKEDGRSFLNDRQGMSHPRSGASSPCIPITTSSPLHLLLYSSSHLPIIPSSPKMTDDPWTSLLATASQPPPPKKHLIICGEPQRGKGTILKGLIGKSRSSRDALEGFGKRRGGRISNPQGKQGKAEKQGRTGAQGTQAEGKEEDPLRLEVLYDPRLKPSEGLMLGYEYVDISPSETGTSCFACSSSPL